MRKQRQDVFLLLLTLFSLFSLANSLCYYPDGRNQASDEYKECPYLNGTISMCCATNRNIPSGGNFSEGFTADGCLSNGLCQNKAEMTNDNGSTFTATTYWREMCSMPDYGNSGCLDVCTSDSNNGSSTDNVRMTPCDGTATSKTWCCGADNKECCGSDSAITIAALFGASTTSETETASPTSNAATSSTATATATSISSSSTGLSDGAKAGIGVGVGVGAVAVIAAVAFWIVRRRKPKENAANKIDMIGTGSVAAAAVVVPGIHQGYTVVQTPGELEGNGVGNRASEKPAGLEDIRHELDGESGRGT